MAEWTEGVMGDGAVILKDGQPIPVDQVIEHITWLESALRRIADGYSAEIDGRPQAYGMMLTAREALKAGG
jgi:hypothetical protein